MATYNYLYLLDSEKSKVYFLSWFVVEKEFPGQTRPKTSDKIIKKIPFLRLVKIVIVQKSY
jgi:hypothetical protein